MPVSYAKLFDLMNQKGLKKVDHRKVYKINPKTVDSLVNNRSVTVDTIIQLCENINFVSNCHKMCLLLHHPYSNTEQH